MMNEGLRDVISIAAGAGARKTVPHGTRKVSPLRNVTASAAEPRRAPSALPRPPGSEAPPLGRASLRMAFSLCGFHEAVLERQRAGECLTDREQSLLALSAADFAEIRPAVVHAALLRLNGVVHDPALLTAQGEHAPAPGELFALETIRNLAARACETLETGGVEAALSLFGAGLALQQPLAIFQAIFSATLAMVESFQGLAPLQAGLLDRLADALDAEVGRI